jgi:hypothetical protein
MAARMYDQSVELRASTCVRIILLCASVRVPLIDTLDSSPRVSVRALALVWWLYSRVEFPWGRASDPVGVAPEPLKEFLTPSRVILPSLQKTLSTPVVVGSDWLVLRGGFDVLSIERAPSPPD